MIILVSLNKQTKGINSVTCVYKKLEWPQNILEACTTLSQLLPGYNFTLEKYPRSEVNQDCLVYSVKHKVSATSEEEPLYQNTIMAISFLPPHQPLDLLL